MFIRFGEMPTDETSGIYHGGLDRTGSEPGVCCYDCIEMEGNFFIVMPMLKSSSLNYDLESFVEDAEIGLKKIYLIQGDLVGRATFNEPCLKNVTILKELQLVNGLLTDKFKQL
jgi:hypothetical protein